MTQSGVWKMKSGVILHDEVATAVSESSRAREGSDHWLAAAYGFAFLSCLTVWFLAIRAPLWTDETLSYWQIAGGVKQIWARSVQGNSFAAYAYILWFTKKIFGDKEIVLRIPSILAMLAAVYVFYRSARELFTWDVSLFATMTFAIPQGIAFAAIDVRPYAFALLMTNLGILLFLRWMSTQKAKYAALFGIATAGIFYFHYLFASMIAALVVYYLLVRLCLLKRDLRQIGAALGCFAVFILPVLPRLKYIYETRVTHSFAPTPHPAWILEKLYPGPGQLTVAVGVVLMAAVVRRLRLPTGEVLRKLLFCASLALVPILCLYGISVYSTVHVFIPRYLLVAVPGIALSWGWLCSIIDSRALRAFFCFAFVGLSAFQAYRSPLARWHEASWKEALAIADANAAVDHATLLMCSPLIEADFLPMPPAPAESVLYSPLSYYKVSAPVVPLPRSLNDEAQRDVKKFLLHAAMEHRRFLVLAPRGPSLEILNFIGDFSRNTHANRVLGILDDIWVVEFVPYSDAP